MSLSHSTRNLLSDIEEYLGDAVKYFTPRQDASASAEAQNFPAQPNEEMTLLVRAARLLDRIAFETRNV